MKEPPVTQPLAGSSGTVPPAAAGPEDDLTGKALGEFQILRRLGQGGMGQVYLAEQLSLKRQVALKIMRTDLAANAISLQRFKLEAEAVARATHANIVQVYAIGEAAGIHYMALEFVEGRNLREFVEKKGPPETLLALSIMRQVAAALQRASELGIIHRDIKPENILLTRKGEVKVADFGLSRCFADNQPTLHLTQTGTAMGTPLYMAPEQVEGQAVDPRTDIYSFGVTCYFMLAGQPPYLGQNPFEVALQHVKGEARPLGEIRSDLPGELCAVVHKMMARRPEHRYQTAREIIRDVARLRDALVGVGSTKISQLLRSGPAPAAVVSTGPAAAPRRRRWLSVAILLAAIGGGALAGWARTARQETPAPPSLKKPAGTQEPLFVSRKEHQQFLETEYGRLANAGDDPDRAFWGLKCAADLGLLYLENGDLDRAEGLFGELDRPGKSEAYRKVGRLGRGIVLAFRDRPPDAILVGPAGGSVLARAVGLNFQDRPRESNRLILEAVPQGKKAAAKGPVQDRVWFNQLIWTNRQWRRMIARALDHNFDNDSKRFPNRLQFLRRPLPGLPRKLVRKG